MARTVRTQIVTDATDDAELIVERVGRAWRVLYRPSESAFAIGQSKARGKLPKGDILVMEHAGGKGDVVTTHPLNTLPTSPGYLRPKYTKLKTISFEGFDVEPPEDEDAASELLVGLPTGFVAGPHYGLGLKREYKYIVDAIERTGANHLRVVWRLPGPPKLDGKTFILSRSLFEHARRAVSSTHDKALRVAADEKRVRLNNQLLSRIDPERFPELEPPYRKDAIISTIGRNVRVAEEMSVADQTAVLAIAKASARQASKREPSALMQLQHEIELVTLESLANRFSELLNAKKTESYWHDFLVRNPFVLHLAFGYPIAVVGDQVSVGGRRFSGSGDKMTDLAVKALASGNIALIEIKGPETKVLEISEYRTGLHAPARELSGAVSQVLDQRYHLQQNIHALKSYSQTPDIETYAVQCLVIAGRTPANIAQQKSLEIYRHSLKSVTVVTYDEMFDKLRALIEFLGGERPAGVRTRTAPKKKRAKSAE